MHIRCVIQRKKSKEKSGKSFSRAIPSYMFCANACRTWYVQTFLGSLPSPEGILLHFIGNWAGKFLYLGNKTYFCNRNKRFIMDEAKVIIDRLRARVAAIMGVQERLKGDLEKRTAERNKALKEKGELESKVAQLEDRIRVLELAGGMKGVSGGSKAARDRVNRLLREVDKCIALMNR